MKLKVYFDICSWTDQSNIFFWGNPPSHPEPADGKRYMAEIEVPDYDADLEKGNVNSGWLYF